MLILCVFVDKKNNKKTQLNDEMWIKLCKLKINTYVKWINLWVKRINKT